MASNSIDIEKQPQGIPLSDLKKKAAIPDSAGTPSGSQTRRDSATGGGNKPSSPACRASGTQETESRKVGSEDIEQATTEPNFKPTRSEVRWWFIQFVIICAAIFFGIYILLSLLGQIASDFSTSLRNISRDSLISLGNISRDSLISLGNISRDSFTSLSEIARSTVDYTLEAIGNRTLRTSTTFEPSPDKETQN